MKALLLVDLQYDFLPDGALAVDDGDAVLPVAKHLAGRYELVVATQDWHPPDHASFAANHPGRKVGDQIEIDGLSQQLWPVHCVQHTHGAELAAELAEVRIDHVFRKGTDPRLDSYSGFFDNGHRKSTGLGDYLHGRGVTAVDVVGLATDYCVKFTVLDARQLGFDVRVILPGCRGVNLAPGDVSAALQDMQAAGAELVEEVPG